MIGAFSRKRAVPFVVVAIAFHYSVSPVRAQTDDDGKRRTEQMMASACREVVQDYASDHVAAVVIVDGSDCSGDVEADKHCLIRYRVTDPIAFVTDGAALDGRGEIITVSEMRGPEGYPAEFVGKRSLVIAIPKSDGTYWLKFSSVLAGAEWVAVFRQQYDTAFASVER